MACPKAAYLYSINHQVLANNFGISLLVSATDTYVLKPENMDIPLVDGATGDTPRVHPGLSLRRDTQEMHTELNAICPTYECLRGQVTGMQDSLTKT